MARTAPPNNTSSLTVGGYRPDGSSFFATERVQSTVSLQSMRLDAQAPDELAKQTTAYLLSRYPRTVRDWTSTKQCKRCMRHYRPVESIGQWQCRRHLLPDRSCCALLESRGVLLTVEARIYGCTPCDHEAAPRLDQSGEELRAAAVPQHLLKMLVQQPLSLVEQAPMEAGARPPEPPYCYLLLDGPCSVPPQCQQIASQERVFTVMTADAPLR